MDSRFFYNNGEIIKNKEGAELRPALHAIYWSCIILGIMAKNSW